MRSRNRLIMATLAALAIGQEQTAAFEIDVFPSQIEDFPQAAAGEEEQS